MLLKDGCFSLFQIVNNAIEDKLTFKTNCKYDKKKRKKKGSHHYQNSLGTITKTHPQVLNRSLTLHGHTPLVRNSAS